ncbi:MAG: hypothetical protein Q8Q41_00310 [bacterium]|nr:hypothetical protein [bacterium]
MKFSIAIYLHNEELNYRAISSLLVRCACEEKRSMADVLGQFVKEREKVPPPEGVTAYDIFNLAEATHDTAPIFGLGMALVYRALDLTPRTFLDLLRESGFRLDARMDICHFDIAEDCLGLPRGTLSDNWPNPASPANRLTPR